MVIAGGSIPNGQARCAPHRFNGAGDGDRRRDQKNLPGVVHDAALQRSRRW